jgi:hypothetical protein
MEIKSEIKKSAVSETVKTIIQWALLPLLTWGVSYVPQIRDQVWPATPKFLLLGILLISLSANLWLFSSLLKSRKRLERERTVSAGMNSNLETLSRQTKSTQDLNDSLEGEITVLRGENERINKELSQHTFDVDETANKILAYLNQPHRDPYLQTMAPSLEIHETRLTYYLRELEERKYISSAKPRPGRPRTYSLAQKGRSYLIKQGLA